mmetsp:Transcript_21220/g.66621  ORF Transcript_21220/g.66621 Transcript_21220/m.66621 type:complete len:245 (-) Transcript_21220:222-956(-)
MPLGQLGPIFAQHEGEVGEARQRKAERLQDEHLADSVGQVLFGPDDCRDSHLGIVHCHAEVVDGHPARPQKDEVTDRRLHVPLYLAADGVVDLDLLAGRHLEPHRVRLTRRHPPRHLAGVRVPPGAVVLWVLTSSLGRLPLGVQLLLRAETRVGGARVDELLSQLLVQARLHPLRLAVRGVGAAGRRTLVVLEAQPRQVGQHLLFRRARRPGRVRILNANNKLSPILPRPQPREERCPCAADMQ